MKPDDNKNLLINAAQLKGKQSVRATFRLSDQIIDLLRVAANHLEVKQKSLIDELVQDKETLNQIACEAGSTSQKEMARRQKTFVLSRNALALLDDISAEHGISRDYLVERCISRLIPLLDSEQEKHKQRRALLKEVEEYLVHGKKILEKADKTLSHDDRFRARLERIIAHTERNVTDLRKFVKEHASLLY